MEKDAQAGSPPHHITWLLETTNLLVGCRSLFALLDLAYDAIRDGLGYDRVELLLADPGGEWLSCGIRTGPDGAKVIADDRLVVLETNAFYSGILRDPRMQVGGPGFIFLEDPTLQASLSERVWLSGTPRQNLLIALRTLDHSLGLISLSNLPGSEDIGLDDTPPLVAFANALAAMMDNVAVLESRAQRITVLDADLRRRVEHLSWLQEASTLLATLQDMESVLDAIYASVRWGLQYDGVSIFLLGHDGTRMTVSEVRGTEEHGEATHGDWRDCDVVDDECVAELYPDLAHLLQGHDYSYTTEATLPGDARRRLPTDCGFCERLVAALRHDGDLVGFVAVDNVATGRPVVEEDSTPLVAYCAQAALAVSRADLWSTLQAQSARLAQRVTELEWLRDVGRQINAARSLDGVLDIALRGIGDGLHFDRVGIWLSDETGTQLEEVCCTAYQERPADRPGVLTLTGECSIDRVPGLFSLIHGEISSYVLDPADMVPGTPSLLPGPASEKLIVALRSSEAVSGFIVVDNLQSNNPILLDQAGALLALASQLGTAVQNTRLQEIEHAERLRLEVLVETSNALNSTLDSDQILQGLATRLVRALHASHVIFSDVRADSRTCVAVAQCAAPGRDAIYPEELEKGLEHDPVLGGVVAEHRIFHGSLDQTDLPESERAFLQAHGLTGEVLAPVSSRGDTIGLLEVYWDQAADLSADTVMLCTAISQQVGIALGNARLYADASQRAELDPLTGLHNHRALLQRLDREVANAASFAIVLLDIDNFKLFNDTYGHLTGDGVLTSVATVIRESCREGDTGGRYGGDELALLLPGATRAEAAAIVSRLVNRLSSRPHVAHDGSRIPISVSAGLACFPGDGHTRRELLAVADAAMYAAKRRTVRVVTGYDKSCVSANLPDLPMRDADDLVGNSPLGVLEGLVSAVDAKDRYTRDHAEHVARLGLLLVDELGLLPEHRRTVTVAGLLHDIGKVGIPDSILRKPGALTAEEYNLIKRHVPFGVAIVKGVIDDAATVEAIACHHERWDGRGYPNGSIC